ncbi:hypothetical protein YS110_03480 [Acidovorax sp. YS12]|jgi:hypothetical protein|nr:hypothetical protein YS110_03480 [Acidovorax sp. YS12]
MRKKWIAAVLVLAAAVGAGGWLLGFWPGTQGEPDGERFSVDTTPLGRLLDTPCTRALFIDKFGAAAMVDAPQINLARHLTMKRLAAFPLAGINDFKLRAMQAEFFKLDPKSPDCQRPAV